MARWKARVQLPIHHNWTFFASSYHWGATSQNVSRLAAIRRGRSLGTKISGGRVVPGEYFLLSTKLDTFCCLTVQSTLCYVPSFWHNTGVWQMDRQTDGIAVASTALAMWALRRAVKMLGLQHYLTFPSLLTLLVLSRITFFTARCFASAVLATAIPSVCHTPVLCQNDGM